jgi:hypothetical protein
MEGASMSSTHPLAEFGGSSLSISLRVRHPSLDPDVITGTLGITPEHFWGCGEPRRSASGAKLGGTHRETYWSATLPEPLGQHSPGQSQFLMEPAALLARHVIQLKRHRAFFDQLRAEGGDASLLLELAPEAETAFRLDASIMRQLAELGLAVEFEILGQMGESAGSDS